MLSKEEMQGFLDRMATAYSKGDACGCAAMFAPDAQLHSSFGPPAIGRAAIEELHREWTAEPSKKRFSILDNGSADQLAWCLCRFSEGNETGDGSSLIVLERNPTGNWLIRSCCLHSDPEAE